MATKYFKYPKTHHLPWSPGVASDDLVLDVTENFAVQEVVVTEKLDGENTSMYCDHIHARSLDSKHHPSRTWVKQFHGQIAHLIPPGWRICGENVYAVHSIAYHELHSYFYVFSIWNEENYCLDWDDTQEWAELLDLSLPRVFYRGVWDEEFLREFKVDMEKCEGYVVRTAAGFAYQEFSRHVAKWVRTAHVQTDQHWMHKQVVANKLASEKS